MDGRADEVIESFPPIKEEEEEEGEKEMEKEKEKRRTDRGRRWICRGS